MNLSLEAREGRVSGDIGSSAMAGIWPYPSMLVEGTLSGGVASIEVFDFVGGEKRIYALGTLTPAENDGLVLTLFQQGGGALPNEALLFRAPTSIEDIA